MREKATTKGQKKVTKKSDNDKMDVLKSDKKGFIRESTKIDKKDQRNWNTG